MRPDRAAKRLAQRQQAVTLSQHLSSATVARQVGVSQRTVFRWLKTYRAHGSAGLAPHSIPGRPRKIPPTQERWIIQQLRAWLEEGKPDARFLAELQDIEARKETQPYLLDRRREDPHFAQAYERYQVYLSRPYQLKEIATRLLRRARIAYHRGHLWRVLKRWHLTAPKSEPMA